MKPAKTIIFLFLFHAALTLQAQYTATKSGPESRIDSLLQAKYQPDAPGAVFLVARKGEILYKKAFGLAHLELNVPMKPENVFDIGSMTKQFTAISILMLKEEGKLNLDDPITRFIPDYPSPGNEITIHHLLTHTSGIRNYTGMKTIGEIAKKDLTPGELIDFFKNEPMDFNPGEQFKYCNSGYVILGYIIELVSGQDYADFVEENIFKPLDMTSSSYADQSRVVKNRASGYHKKDDYMKARHISYSIPYAAGSLRSNVNDMLKWQQAIMNDVLFSRETREKAFANYTLNNGESIDYGYGWHIKTLQGQLSYEHGGSIFGFKSMGVYLPESDIYVIGLNNCDCSSPTEVTRQIAEIMLDHSGI